MTEFKLSAEERETLARLRESDGWPVFDRIISNAIDEASFSLNNTLNDHRYWQGKIHGLWKLKCDLIEFAKPEKELKYVPPEEFSIFGGKPSSSTDY